MRKRSSRTCFEREARHAAMVLLSGKGLYSVVWGKEGVKWREEEDYDERRGFCADRRAAACSDPRHCYAAPGKVHLGNPRTGKDRPWECTGGAPCSAVQANRGMNKLDQELLAMLLLRCPSSLINIAHQFECGPWGLS